MHHLADMFQDRLRKGCGFSNVSVYAGVFACHEAKLTGSLKPVENAVRESGTANHRLRRDLFRTLNHMSLTTQPFAESKELDAVRATLSVNVPSPERLGSIAAGAGLVLYGISRRSLGGVLVAVLGGALIRRGATGHCEVYEKMGVNSRKLNPERGVSGNKGINVEERITVARAPQEVYQYWRKLENLPRFMEHVESVRELDQRRSAWVVKGPMGHEVKWTAEIISDHPGEMISWESLPGAEVQNAGSVWFEPAGNGSSTEVKVSLQYQPPADVVGATLAKLFGEAPEQQLEADLGRFKDLIEAGAVEAAVGSNQASS